MSALELALFGFGYPTSIGVLSRFVPVVRQRRWRWLVTHHLAVAAIVAGWLVRGRPSAAGVNAAWLVVASAWYLRGRDQGNPEGAGRM